MLPVRTASIKAGELLHRAFAWDSCCPYDNHPFRFMLLLWKISCDEICAFKQVSIIEIFCHFSLSFIDMCAYNLLSF